MIVIYFLTSAFPPIIIFHIIKDLSIAVDINVSFTIKIAEILSEWAEYSYINYFVLRSNYNILIS